MTDPDEPRGCLMIQCGLVAGPTDSDIPKVLATRRRNLELLLRKRLEQAKDEGNLSVDADPSAMARYLQTVFMGLGVQAAAGASASELRSAAEPGISRLD